MGERGQGAEDAGIGEQDVEFAPALQQSGAKLLDRSRIAEVDRNQRRTAANALNLIIEFFKRARGSRQSNDMGAGIGEGEGCGAANTARRALREAWSS